MDLKIENLSKHFGSKTAVDRINLHMHEGIYGFLGANRAGKTTLMRIVCGILKPTEGSVKVNGRDHLAMGEEFRGMLGYLPQDFGYFPGFTAREFMEYSGALKGLLPGYARKRGRELLDVVGLADAAEQRIKTFSGECAGAWELPRHCWGTQIFWCWMNLRQVWTPRNASVSAI